MKFKLVRKQMKEIRSINYNGSRESLLTRLTSFVKQKRVMFMGAVALTAAIMVPGQSAFADEAPEVIDVNEGVTPIEQPAVVQTEDTLATELDNAGVTIDTPVVETTPDVQEPVVDQIPEVETPEVETPEVDENTEETPKVEETTENEMEDAKEETSEKDGFLEVIDGESHKTPESVDLPSAGDNSNPFGFVINNDGSAIAIYSPNEAMSLDEVNTFIENVIKSKLAVSEIQKNVIIKMLTINPDINEPVVYDLSKFGLGTIMVSKNADGTYKMSFDGTADIEVITGTMTNDKNHSLDPDTTDVYKGAPEEPTPEKPTPEEPTPEEPTFKEPIPEGYAELAQTGDNTKNIVSALGLLALGAAGAAGAARRRMRR